MADDKKRSKAAAIRYEKGESAPTVIAKGMGVVADNLIEKAREFDVPIVENVQLAEALTKLEIGDYIPPELYTVVAEILVFVTDLDKLRDK